MPPICTGHLHLVFSCSGLQKVSQSHNSTNVKIDGVEKMGEQVFDLTSHIAENFELNLHGALSQVVGSKRVHKLFPNGKVTKKGVSERITLQKKLLFSKQVTSRQQETWKMGEEVLRDFPLIPASEVQKFPQAFASFSKASSSFCSVACFLSFFHGSKVFVLYEFVKPSFPEDSKSWWEGFPRNKRRELFFVVFLFLRGRVARPKRTKKRVFCFWTVLPKMCKLFPRVCPFPLSAVFVFA